MGRGQVTFDGKKLNRMHAHKICKAGIAYVPEGREVFPNMTVLENLEMGAYCRSYTAAQMNEKLEEMYTMFPRLKERLKQKAGSMSGGEQQMLAIARGLMSDPSMVMLDEPSLGLAPVIVDDVFDVIHNINTVKKSCPSSLSSRTPTWRFQSPIAAMCWKTAASPTRARAVN